MTVSSTSPHGLYVCTFNYTVTTCPSLCSGSEVRGSNRGPVAVVGPDRQLLLPMSNLLLDGGGSTDDCGIASYRWDAVRWDAVSSLKVRLSSRVLYRLVSLVSVSSGPLGLKLEGADQAVATASGLRVGRYTFRLTVSDQQGETDRASLTVRVQEGEKGPDRLNCATPDLVLIQLLSSSGSHKPPPRGSCQWQPHRLSAQQLSGPSGRRDRRRPDRGPLSVGQRQPESCCWGQYIHDSND